MSDVAVVTGGAHGVGAAISLALSRGGFDVVVADLDAPAANATAESLSRTGARALAHPVDVGDRASLKQLLATATAFGRVDVLVNCAAITQARPLMEITSDEFLRVMAVNAGGTFAASQLFGAAMAARGYGRIINIASLAGQNGGTATGGHYAASKGAILALTKVFARELADSGVTVNAIAPGPHRTNTVESLVGAENMEEFVRAIPVGRIGDPDFLAKMVLLLAGRGAEFVTGATWDVNGGLYLR